MEAQERRYIQDEWYIAREHMDVRRDCVSFAHRVISACFSFAQSHFISMDAKAAQCLTSGHAVKHPCALILDLLSRKVLK